MCVFQSPFQVGILLHYSTLATVLWVGVTARNIYKQVTRKVKRCQDPDELPPPPRPMLRYRHLRLPNSVNRYVS